MNKLKRILIAAMIVVILNMAFVIPVFADTSATVTVTYTVEYIAIADNVTAYDFGTVATSSTTDSLTGYFGITNTSSVQTDNKISVTGDTWTGGTAHTHSNTATAGADTVGLKSSNGDGAFDVVVQADSAVPQYIQEDIAASTNWTYEMRLLAPTGTSDGVQKTNTVKITAASG